MKYLFFDIECANCFDGKGKICEFGYIQTDENFSVIIKESIKINPRADFDLKGFAMRGIKLEEPFEYYRKLPDFKNFYDKIKKLLQTTNQVLVGHGVENDARYLIDECERYNLPHINFEYCDTCELAKLIYKREKGLKLKQLYKDFCHIENVEQKHRSLDDSFMTMEIAKSYVKNIGKTMSQIKLDYPLANGESFNGRIVKAGVPDLGYVYKRSIGDKNKKFIQRFLSEEMDYTSNKKYVLSNELIKSKIHFQGLVIILLRLKELRMLYSYDFSNGCVYVLDENKNRRLDRYNKYLDRKNCKPYIKTQTFQDFLNEIGLTEQDLDVSEKDLETMIGNLRCNKTWYDEYQKNMIKENK